MELPETNGKYVLPLDSVDLSLLSTLNVAPKHHNDLLPLWSTSNLRLRNEDCYLEFEIKDKEDISDMDTYYDNIKFGIDDKQDISESKVTYISSSENSSNPDVNIEISTNLCYICNIEVPLPYMKEHIDSYKHKTFLKIAEVALERVKKQTGHFFSNKNSVSSMYFCQTCVTVTPVKDKSFHMKSNAHKNAVILDRLLNDFLKIYTHEELETDNTELEIETSNHEDIVKPVSNEDMVKEIISNLKPAIFQKINNDAIVSSDTNLTEYINILNAKTLSSHKLKDVNGEYLIIETKDGSQLKVTHNNFHGVLAIGKSHAQCKLCTEIFRNLDKHIYSQKHIEKIVLPINDKECIRELDNTKSHCILCNELVESADFHALCNKRHEASLKSAILLPEEENESQIKIETRSNVNKPNIITPLESNEEQEPKDCAAKTTDNNIDNAQLELEKNESVAQSKASKTDTSKAKNFFCTVCYVSLHKKDIRSHERMHKVAEKCTFMLEYSVEADYLKCKVCNCLVDPHYTVHLMSADHAERYNALLAANKMITKEENVFCEACTVYVPIENELDHIDSLKHRELLLDFERKLSTKSTGNDIKQWFCVVCQDNVPNNTHCISKHFSGNLHKHNVANYQTCTKHVKSTRENLENVSKIEEENASINPLSEIFLKDTSSESVAINIPVAKGNGEIDTKKDTNSNPITQTASEHDIKNSMSVTSETAEDVLEITLNPNELRCRICLVIIPNKTQNIQEHFNGYEHINSARILLVQNRLKLIENQYFCDGCREHVAVGDQFDHINKRSHAVNMIRTLTNDIVNAFAKNQDKRDTKSYKDTIIKRQDKIVNCQVCNVKVPKINLLKMHIEGRKHVRKLRKILSHNKILEKDDCFNCCVCQTVLTKDALFNHLKNQNHLTALGTKLPISILTTLFRYTEEI